MDNEIFTPDQKLLALSWKQPYAEMMLHGKIETRTWKTNYRGWVLICASQTEYKLQQLLSISGPEYFKTICDRIRNKEPEIYRFRGHAVAIGKLVDCQPMKPEDAERCYVQYYPDLFCHIYENVQAIEPIRWKGSQGWREVPEEIKQKIKFI